MAKFSWEGTTRAGEKRRGVIEAETRGVVEDRLRSDNITIQNIKREGQDKLEGTRRRQR